MPTLTSFTAVNDASECRMLRLTRTRVRRWLCIGSLVLVYVFLIHKVFTGVTSADDKQDLVSLRSELIHGPAADHAVGPSDVLISSYMRSGSSFLGQVLGFRKDTFYVYEPLWTMVKYSYFRDDSQRCDVFSKKCSQSKKLPMALTVLRQIYNCSFYEKPAAARFFENINIKLSGPRWHSYYDCPGWKGRNSSTCLRPMADKKCRSSLHKVTKVLRLSIRNNEHLLQSNNNLKVVYLVRDPRAILNSHMRTGWSRIRRSDVSSVTSAAVATCGRIEDDVTAAMGLREKYPGRLIIVQYEDFADPLPKIKLLYKFLNISFSNEVMKHIIKAKDSKADADRKTGSKDALKEMEDVVNKLSPEYAKRFQKNMNNRGGKKENMKNDEIADDALEAESAEDDYYNDDTIYNDNKSNAIKDDIPDEDEDSNMGGAAQIPMRGLKSVQVVEDETGDGNHPFKYRETLSWTHVKIIDKHCERVYKLLGYRKYTSEKDLRDLSKPAVIDRLSFSL